MAKVPVDTIWQQFSRSIGGLFAGNGFFEPPMIRLDHRVWTLLLEALNSNPGTLSEQVYTVLYAAYRPAKPFTLSIRPSRDTRDEAACLDGDHMTIGYDNIDRAFTICSTDAYLTRWLLSYGNLTGLLAASPRLHLYLGSSLWYGIHDPRVDDGDAAHLEEIVLRQPGVLRDAGSLKQWFDAVQTLLDQLLDAGLIHPEMPDLDAPLRQAQRWGGLWMSRKGRVPLP